MPDEVNYCATTDITLPHVVDAAPDDLNRFIRNACDEIDGKLGLLYEVPLPFDSMVYHEKMLIKTIATKLAMGRYILSVTADEAAMHSYGLRLIQEGLDELHIIAGGEIALRVPQQDWDDVPGIPDEAGAGAIGARTPTSIIVDSESLLNGFNQTVLNGRPYYVRPDDAVDLP